MIKLLDEMGSNFKYELKPINFKSKEAEKNVKKELDKDVDTVFNKSNVYKKITLDLRRNDFKS